MRKYFIFLALFAIRAIASGPIDVDGVAVDGNVDAMPLSDIRSAISAYQHKTANAAEALTVADKDHIHVYLEPRDLGWMTVERMDYIEPDHSVRHAWSVYCQGLPEYPVALHLIKTATAVYVFSNPDPLYPRRDDKHMRLLDAKAQAALIDALGAEADWWNGLYEIGGHDQPATDVGFVFKNGKDELVLFMTDDTFGSGNLNGEFFKGMLNGGPSRKLKEWTAKYAQAEMAVPSISPPGDRLRHP